MYNYNYNMNLSFFCSQNIFTSHFVYTRIFFHFHEYSHVYQVLNNAHSKVTKNNPGFFLWKRIIYHVRFQYRSRAKNIYSYSTFKVPVLLHCTLKIMQDVPIIFERYENTDYRTIAVMLTAFRLLINNERE